MPLQQQMQPQQFQSSQNQYQSQQVITNLQHAQTNQTSIQSQAMLPKLDVKQKQQQQQQQPHHPLQQTQSKIALNTQTTIVSGKEPQQVAPKFIELPKIDPNSQQLFSLNTISNQITQLSPGLTTAALGPMERLLIVPAGINAQQLAQCLLQGQIHFNNIGQAAPIQSSQQSMPAIQQPPQNMQHSMQQPQPLQSPNVGSVPPKKVQPIAEAKPRKTKPRAKKTESVKPVQQVVQPLPKTNQMDIKPQNQIEVQKTNLPNSIGPPSSSFPTQTSAVPPTIQFNNHHSTSGTQQNVQIVRPSIQQPISSPIPRAMVNNNHQVMSTGASNPGQRMTMNQPRPPTQLQSNQMQSPMNHLPNGPNMSAASMSAVPPLVSVHPIPQQHLSGSQSQQTNQPRVQTIQLTPQKQQLLKNVQMQIQSLSTRLQNKSLLSTLTIPPDFDLNNPIHNKPLPMLSNMNAMSDTEIHQALQRLFIEQQKILATGKVIAPMTSSQPTFASGPVNTQPSTAIPKPAIQYGQPPTSNTLPTKPSAVVPTTTTPKAKPKSRAKANKQTDATKAMVPISVAPQNTTPILINRQATIRMATTASTVPPSDQIKQSAPTNIMIQPTNQSYALHNTNATNQPPSHIEAPSTSNLVSSSGPIQRLPQPSSLTIMPAPTNIANNLIRQQAPSHVTMTLQPVVPKGVVLQQLPTTQIGHQPTSTNQKPQPTTKVNNVQLKTQPISQQQAVVRSAMNVTTTMSSAGSPHAQIGPNSDQKSIEQFQSHPISQPQQPTTAYIQQQEEPSPQPSLVSTQSPTLCGQTADEAPVAFTPDSQPLPGPVVEHQPPASPKMKVPRHCL